jgi:hypothetical protein
MTRYLSSDPFGLRHTALFGAMLFALAFTVGCDSGGGLDDDANTTVSAEETAESVAFSTAEATGGTTAELADAAAVASGAATKMRAKTVTASRECTYETDTEMWTCRFSVEGSRARIDTINVEREYRAQFFSGNTVVRAPADADSMTFEIVRGSGLTETARIENSHTLIGSTWTLSGLQTDAYTIRLLSSEAGRDVNETYTAPRRSRVREASVRKTRIDEVVWAEGQGLQSGTIEGTYDAAVDIERLGGETVTRTVNVDYEVVIADGQATLTFTGGGERFTGERFSFDLSTGELE